MQVYCSLPISVVSPALPYYFPARKTSAVTEPVCCHELSFVYTKSFAVCSHIIQCTEHRNAVCIAIPRVTKLHRYFGHPDYVRMRGIMLQLATMPMSVARSASDPAMKPQASV
jgi:hypothetical protein